MTNRKEKDIPWTPVEEKLKNLWSKHSGTPQKVYTKWVQTTPNTTRSYNDIYNKAKSLASKPNIEEENDDQLFVLGGKLLDNINHWVKKKISRTELQWQVSLQQLWKNLLQRVNQTRRGLKRMGKPMMTQH